MRVLAFHLAFISHFMNPVNKHSLQRNLSLIRFNKIGFQMWPVRNRYDRLQCTLMNTPFAFILRVQDTEIGPTPEIR